MIEGDQQTSRDAERIAATGIEVVQINTGKACHLDAQMVGRALKELDMENGSILFVENVGNLVCPAEFDLGEEKRVVMISVTEGDDKPLKYPSIFASSDLMIVTKIDLSPHVDFDCEACIRYAKRLKPSIEIIRTSAKTGEGLEEWYHWIGARLMATTSRSQAECLGRPIAKQSEPETRLPQLLRRASSFGGIDFGLGQLNFRRIFLLEETIGDFVELRVGSLPYIRRRTATISR